MIYGKIKKAQAVVKKPLSVTPRKAVGVKQLYPILPKFEIGALRKANHG